MHFFLRFVHWTRSRFGLLCDRSAHLQKQHSEKLTAEERDVIRADMVRDRLRQVSRPIVRPALPPEGGLDKPSK